MDFNKLSANEKLAVYGSAAVIVAGLIGIGVGGIGLLAVLAAIAMLAVVFLPQFSPNTTLPGSKGSLLLILGGVAAIVMVLGLLQIIGALGFWFEFQPLGAIFFLVAVAGAVLMAWAGWQEFRAEGGKFVLGTPAGGSASAPAAPRTDTIERTDTAPPAVAPPAPVTDVDEDRPASPTV
ncbi:MAG: hypothetical protein ABI534_11090 [Chloroflexota bacterium]